MSKIDVENFLAYPPEFHALETVMRVQAVKRWHMLEVSRTQTLAEHSCNVALLAALIARTAPHSFFDAWTKVAYAALVHDVPESFTGDTPSHTKQYISGLSDLEDKVTPPAMKTVVSPDTKILIKMCDFADGIRFIRLHGVDLTARHAQVQIEAKLAEKFKEASGWKVEVYNFVYRHIMFYAYEKVE
ncbi:COG1896 Predicted hydrolases of HD superfamily [uncultured Caudovirales phage]|uniref:COG1896 Predicted hydrolases of HD superfamily n=1 Tax=uncultured Caudovirales phage TaxID=2100421 RepID=A0A6J5PBT0_9CAUD|nr:COG1896 Predicted hydrolases of HD superfamily [uncultured Caudovirales phage]